MGRCQLWQSQRCRFSLSNFTSKQATFFVFLAQSFVVFFKWRLLFLYLFHLTARCVPDAKLFVASIWFTECFQVNLSELVVWHLEHFVPFLDQFSYFERQDNVHRLVRSILPHRHHNTHPKPVIKFHLKHFSSSCTPLEVNCTTPGRQWKSLSSRKAALGIKICLCFYIFPPLRFVSGMCSD